MNKVKTITFNINTARVELSNNVSVLEREDVENIISAAGFPKGSGMMSQCVKFGIINKRGNNKYTLPEKPIYYQKVANAIDAYHAEKNAVAALYRARLKRECKENANFLRKHGYVVIGTV